MARANDRGTTPQNVSEGGARVTVRNIGGISECDVEFAPGVTVLSGENATNRTSLLRAMIGVLGGESAMLKSDADEGTVKLHRDGNTYSRRYTRQGSAVTTDGDPLSDDSDIVDLFVGLVEQNDARRAVERGEDLRDVIMRPVDTGEIRDKIRERERERDRIADELADIERKRSRRPELEERRENLEAEMVDLTTDLEAVRETIDEHDASETEAREAESLLEEIDELRQERDRVQREIDTQRSSIESLREERNAVDAELDDIAVDESDLEALDREIDRLQDRKRELEDLISDLSAIVDVNDDLANADTTALPGVGNGGSDPASALDPSSPSIECWTCGTEVTQQAIADRLEEVRAVVDDQRDAHRSVVRELEEATSRRADIHADADRRDDLETRLREIDREIRRRNARVESLQADATEIEQDVDALETRLEEADELDDSELVDHYQRLSDLEYQRGQLDQQLDAVETELDDIQQLADVEAQLEAQRDELRDEVDALRSRIEDLERSAVTQFNDRMDDVLDRLAYDNVERVWIERKTDANGRDASTRFDLHVVRESDAGAVYEDSVETLSESEREIIGLVVALAGYLVHEVHQDVPFMLLDSLEAIDAERIDALLEYLADYAPYLVVALLPEDAAVVDVDHERVSADALAE